MPPESLSRHPVRDIFANAQSGRTLIQDFSPLPDSIEWQLGQSYLRERGNRAFINDPEPVPFVVNNDGSLSANAAAVCFAGLLAADKAGALEPEIFVLELGIGVGLFARFFLDTFRSLCDQHHKDYYDRLCYAAGDYAPAMLQDACRHGVFANHPGRYVTRVVDALAPADKLANDSLFGEIKNRPFRAVFLNYLLDCLPATVLQMDDKETRQLCVRTCLARGTDLKGYSDLTVEDLTRLAKSSNPVDRQQLRQVYPLLASEYDFQPVDLAGIPYANLVNKLAGSAKQRSILHSYGAIQCLDRLLPMLRDGGFILINDYGSTKLENADDFQHQRFSQSTFIGINFPLLRHCFTGVPIGTWHEPDEGDDASIHARLLGHKLAPETIESFEQVFHKDHRKLLQQPVERARQCVKTGRFESALSAYQQALEQQPCNWVIMSEVAHFLTFALRSHAAGLEMAKAALACNPTCSADLWNTLADCLYELGRVEESRQAMLHGLEINPDDVRSRYNLAFVHARTGEYADGLKRIAEALALDKAGTYRERLLHKQSELLTLLAHRSQQEYQRMADRVSTRIDPAQAAGGKVAPGPAAAGSTSPPALNHMSTQRAAGETDRPGESPTTPS
jgi:Tfp pilus assembly protein PilF